MIGVNDVCCLLLLSKNTQKFKTLKKILLFIDSVGLLFRSTERTRKGDLEAPCVPLDLSQEECDP